MKTAKATVIEEGIVKASQVTDRNLQRVYGVQSWRGRDEGFGVTRTASDGSEDDMKEGAMVG
ncbi:hypothetical protein ACSBR1_035526 [Camellia fascicularis]